MNCFQTNPKVFLLLRKLFESYYNGIHDIRYMKYYITADVHGFYTKFHKALDEAGYFNDSASHKLIILGDIFDRGQEAVEMQEFILQLMGQDAVILIRGNHEDLFEEMVRVDEGLPVRHHVSNGTYGTALVDRL